MWGDFTTLNFIFTIDTWKTINEKLNRTKRKTSFPLFFKDGNSIIANKLLIANKFNSFFTNIGINLYQQTTAHKNKSFKDYLTPRHCNIFQFKNINEESVNHIIEKLALKTSLVLMGCHQNYWKVSKAHWLNL